MVRHVILPRVNDRLRRGLHPGRIAVLDTDLQLQPDAAEARELVAPERALHRCGRHADDVTEVLIHLLLQGREPEARVAALAVGRRAERACDGGHVGHARRIGHQQRDADVVHRGHDAAVEGRLRLGRVGANGEHAQVDDLALRLEVGRAGEARGEDEDGAHQNFTLSPSVGRMGIPEMLPCSRKR